MGSLEKTKRKFLLVLGMLGLLDLLLVAYLVWPGTSLSSLQAREQSLQEKERALTKEVAPLIGIDEKLVRTRADVKKLYEEKVPTEFSQISQHLDKLTKETGVTTTGIHYSQDRADRNEKGDLPEVQRVHIDTTVTGEYAKIAHFINGLEQDKFIFVIDQISLNSQESGATVSLQIKFETFLHET